MIAYTRINKSDLQRIHGVFLNVPVLVMKSIENNHVQLENETGMGWAPSERVLSTDSIIVILSDDLDRVKDRAADFKIRGLRWRPVAGEKYGEWAYLGRDGDIKFRIARMRKPLSFYKNATYLSGEHV